MAIQIEFDYPEPQPVELDPARTLLVVVDICNETCNPEGHRYGGEIVSRIIPPTVELRRRVREAGGQVIHTQSVRAPDALEFKMGNSVHHLEGSWGADFVDELRPAPDEHVVVKRSHDCFNDTEMASLLQRLGAQPGETQVIVTGTATRGCVECAVKGFSVRDYWVYVPMDCTAQKDEREILLAFDHFTGWGYRYNTTMTRSDLISFAPARVAVEKVRAS